MHRRAQGCHGSCRGDRGKPEQVGKGGCVGMLQPRWRGEGRGEPDEEVIMWDAESGGKRNM